MKKSIKIILILLIVFLLLFLSKDVLFEQKNKIIKDISDKQNNNSVKSNDKKNSIEKNNDNNKEEKDINNSEPKSDEQSEVKQELNNNITANIELVGDDTIKLSVGEKYTELGAKATDSNGNDISSKIIIDGKVDTSKSGEYIIIYSIGKSMVIRNVIVK